MPDGYKVSIELAAKVGDYVRGMGVAATATGKLESAQKGAVRSSAELADELTRAGKAGAESAVGLRAAASGVRSLERAEAKLAATRKDMPKAPTGGSNKDTLLGAVIPDRAKTQKVGQDTGTTLLESITGAFTSKVGVLGQALTGVAAASAPLIGATIAGAVVGAAGVGGVAGGLALAARDTRVKTAGKALGKQVLSSLENDARFFVNPALDGIATVKRGFADIEPDIERLFRSSSKFVQPLVEGATSGVQKVVHGIADASEQAQPVIDQLGSSFDRIGGAVGDVFSTLSDDADEGASAIGRVTDATVELIDVTGGLIHGLAEVYGTFEKIDSFVHDNLGASITELLGLGGPLQQIYDLYRKVNPAEGGRRTGSGTFGGKDSTHLLSATEAATKQTTAAQEAMAEAEAQAALKQQLLNGSMHDGIAAAGGLADALELLFGNQADGEKAEIAYQQAIDDVTASIKANGRSLDAHTEKGRANRTALLGVRDAALQRAQAAYDEAGGASHAAAAEYAAGRALTAGRAQLVRSAMQYGLTRKRAEAYANSILKIPKQWKTHLSTSGFDEATGKVRTIKQELASMKTNWSVTVRTSFLTFGKPYSQDSINRGQVGGLAKGGVLTPMAAGGVASIYPASNPPLYQFAEPETGGEAFIPKNGDRKRNLSILSEVARWPSVNAMVVPMAAGGVTAAANGLVNVATSSTTTRGTRLESAQAYLSARDAVGSLSKALRENGRQFAASTTKGRENRSAVYAAVDAAKQAAQAKYAETGSLRAANRAYDEHILRLRRTLAQQKVNARTQRELLAVAGRPSFDVPAKAPVNSLNNIAYTKSRVQAAQGITELGDTLSLNKAVVGIGTAEGRENILAIIGFLEQAASVAQDRYTQTGSSKAAKTAYNALVKQLRTTLGGAGYSKSLISSLINQYGRITLQPNAAGGVYGGLTQAAAYGPGQTLYAFREPSTRGEAFIPRNGDQERSERILSIAAGWHGGQYTPKQQLVSGGSSYASHMTVVNNGEPLTVARVQQVQRQADVRNRVGRGK